jgi:hypothetical protein
MNTFASQAVFNAATNLSPVMCEDGINYRVPVQVPTIPRKKDDTHVVHVGNMSIRVFTDDTLPDFIRVRLSMIRASGGGGTLDTRPDSHLSILDLFRTRHGNLEGVGWQASDTMFVVVMSRKELSILKGMI